MATRDKRDKTLVVGLTGGIAAGKSTAAKFFAEYGASIIDADSVARAELEQGGEVSGRVIDSFGEQILDSEGNIDRRKLAGLVFFDSERLRVLNEITHPSVNRVIAEQIRALAEADIDVVVVEHPLLIGSTVESLIDKVIVVEAPAKLRVERLKESGLSEREAWARIGAQQPEAALTVKADFLIKNSGSVGQLKAKVRGLSESLNKDPGESD